MNATWIFYFIYMCLATTIIPLPTPQLVMYMGMAHPHYLVAIVGGIATTIAGLIDYYIITKFVAVKQVKTTVEKITHHKTFHSYQNWFMKRPFTVLFVASMTPLPFDPIRIAAILLKYNPKHYALSIFLGRTIRYLFLASVGGMLSGRYLVVVVVAGTIIGVVCGWIKGKRQNPQNLAE